MANYKIRFEEGYSLEQAITDIVDSDNECDNDCIFGSDGSDAEVNETEIMHCVLIHNINLAIYGV